MDKVKIGVIGYGQRSHGLMDILLGFSDVEVAIVCDKYEDRAKEAKERVIEKAGNTPISTTDYKQVLDLSICDSVLIATDWELHVPIACEAMEKGLAVALEVGGVYTVDDCWKLVDTWEKTKVPFMFLENCCFHRDELLATAIARKGDFGKIVALSGSYTHDLRSEVTRGKENRHYRLRNYLSRNCENYPTHELGPMAKVINVNRGNRMLSMVTMTSGAFGMKQYVLDNKDNIDPVLLDADFKQGDVVHTIITCANGEVLTLKLDTCLPTSYSREFCIRGTKGMYSQDTNSVYLDGQREYIVGTEFIEDYKNSAEKYKSMLPKHWQNITKEALEAGHGGMDFVELREFIDRLKRGEEMPIDVYDAASWMVITPLSEISIKTGKAVEIPDFTRGKWREREPKDVLDFLEYNEEKANQNVIERVVSRFIKTEKFVSYAPLGNGHINSTFLVETNKNKYVLQKINTNIFKDVEGLMSNIGYVTEFLSEKGSKTLNFLTSDIGKKYVFTGGDAYRMYVYVDNAYTIEKMEDAECLYNAGVGFGTFAKELTDFDAKLLVETIKNFHHTRSRYNDFEKAVLDNLSKRREEVKAEIEFIRERKEFTSLFVDLIEKGDLPLRVTHNDTKINNVLMSVKDNKPVAVIDLDTVMPGSYLYDFGDALRFGATRASEDEKNLDIVHFELDLFEKFTKGYLETCGKSLTKTEIEMLPYAPIMMTLECGMRFLADYINGDVYFKIHRKEHNLDRARTQLKLVYEMEKSVDKMKEIIQKYL